MEKYLIYLIAGFCDGIIRGLVGFVKNKTIEKANHFKPEYFIESLYKIKLGQRLSNLK